MAGLNKVMVIGNLGRDPEIRYSQQGTAVVNFSVATSDEWFDKNTNQKQERTEWHRIVVFGKMAETCERYLSKGRQVYVEGKLRTNSYEKDGQTHYATDVIASTVQFLGGRQDNQGGGQDNQGGGGGYQQAESGSNNHSKDQTSPGMTGGQEPIPDDDIPF
ncbi:single-stranded DNA-binding protein [Desulfobacula sp.]|uniref:single-stranded DNA-binding protein n=1 Tax=Desulfobacula sp. TaxID=2593537 RepID=UPI00263935F4|nr:single-stranded DNA-binding protein [Desulfobacula sp.]